MKIVLITTFAVVGGAIGFCICIPVYFTWPESTVPLWANPFTWAVAGASIAGLLVAMALKLLDSKGSI